MRNFLKTINSGYSILLEQEPPMDAALPPPPEAQAQIPPQTPEQVDQQGETENTRQDSDKILLVNIINKLINLSISSISAVVNSSGYTEEQREIEKDDAQDKLSKLKQLIDSINKPEMKLNDIINTVNISTDSLTD